MINIQIVQGDVPGRLHFGSFGCLSVTAHAILVDKNASLALGFAPFVVLSLARGHTDQYQS